MAGMGKDGEFKTYTLFLKEQSTKNDIFNTEREGHLLLFTDNCVSGKPKKLNYKSMANNTRIYELNGYKISA